jgi:hypothetical protein
VTKDLLNQLAFVRRGALYADRQGKTAHIGDSKDLRVLATPGWPNCQAPFLADARRKPRPTSAARGREAPLLADEEFVPAFFRGSNFGIGGGPSDRADTLLVTPATDRPCLVSTTRHSALTECLATVNHDHQPVVSVSSEARSVATDHRRVPIVRSCPHFRPLSCATRIAKWVLVFMRPVLVSWHFSEPSGFLKARQFPPG